MFLELNKPPTNLIYLNIKILKARELAHYLIGKKKVLDFSNPNEPLERVDTEDLRQKILAISVMLNGKRWAFLEELCTI